jgi:hypothetical protein
MTYRTLNLRIAQVGIAPGLLWFRVFGKGLHIKDPRRHPPLFSERNRMLPYVTILGYRVRFLG